MHQRKTITLDSIYMVRQFAYVHEVVRISLLIRKNTRCGSIVLSLKNNTKPVVDTHFRDTFSMSPIQPISTSLWAQFVYYIIFYYFKHGPNPCGLFREIEGVWFEGYGLIPFGPFAWAQHKCVTKWARDTGSTSGSSRRSCIQNFHFKRGFMLWVTVPLIFSLAPFSTPKHSWS